MVGIRSLSLALLTLALLPASAAATPTTQIIVKREPGLSAAERAGIRADADVRFVETLPLPGTEVVAAEPGDVSNALRDLNADPGVVVAAHDRAVHSFSDDEYFVLQWALENTGQPPYFGADDADLEVPPAWTLTPPGGPTVGVVDSGVDAAHPDLNGSTPEAGDPIVAGYDWVDDDSDPADELPAGDPAEGGHGTHVTGTIVAERGNGLGIAGVAPGARAMPLRVLDENGDGRVSDLVQAFHFADQAGVRIINASFGARGADTFERQAIAAANDVLFVVAAGNEGLDNDGLEATYPCAYDLPNILCVGASDYNDDRPSYSNYGGRSVDVFAPGSEVLSTVPTAAGSEPYNWKNGTSMAAPHVSGLAALMLTRDPTLTAAELKSTIIATVDRKPAFENISVSGGRVDAQRALEHVFPDRDADGIDNVPDNCDTVANPSQGDMDGDGAGDVCDTNARGHDNDRDGKPALDDSCPTVYGTLANGCPVPPPPPPPPPSDRDGDGRIDAGDGCPDEPAATVNGCPIAQIAALSPRVKKRSATVRVSTTRAASVTITVERKKGRRWVRVARKTRATVANKTSLTVKRLKRGAHRVKVSISSSGGAGTPRTKSFRVR